MEATFDPAAGLPPSLVTAEFEDKLGRDEFIKLLIAKMESQDPLQPARDTEFVEQLATFSSLEQLIAVNDNLEALGAMQGELINSQALGLLGREALVENDGTLEIRSGEADAIVYQMPREARDATLTVVDSTGTVVRTFQLQGAAGGRVDLPWDGLDDAGEPLPDGRYTIRAHATDLDGEPMTIGLFRAVPIEGVSFLEGSIALVSAGREIPFESIFEIRAGRV